MTELRVRRFAEATRLGSRLVWRAELQVSRLEWGLWSRMKICIDGFNLAMRKGTGIATYARNLNSSIRALGEKTHILYGPKAGLGRGALLNEVALVDAQTAQYAPKIIRGLGQKLTMPFGRAPKHLVRTGEVDTRQVEHNIPPCDGLWASTDIFEGANRSFAALGGFTAVRFRGGAAVKPEVMHWTAPLPMHATGLANLYTLHDLVPLKLPFASLENKRRFHEMCLRLCARADRIVTVSNHSKQDIMRIFGVEEGRIAVTYQAVDVPASMLDEPDEDVARTVEGVLGLEWRSYFLFFGAVEPKKNLPRIIEAYLSSGVNTPLIIVGGRAWLEEDETRLLKTIQESSTERAELIRRYDYLPFRMLVSLIRGAKATLLPSLYEGFGLPVLESMQLRTPVLTSTAGSLPEVAGDAALMVDPYDTVAIRRAMVALDADADLRADLVERGVRQAQKFGPEPYRGRLAELYSQVG